MKLVADAGRNGWNVAENQTIKKRDHLATDDGPHRWPEISPYHRDDQRDDRGAAVNSEEPPNPHVTRQTKQIRAIESAYQDHQRENWEQVLQLRIMIEDGHRPADRDRDKPENDATDQLDRPCRVQEIRIVPAW